MLSYTCAVNTSYLFYLFIFVLNTTLALLPNLSVLNLHYWSRSPHGGWEPLTAFNSVALIQLSANLQHGAWKKLTAPAPAVITLAFVFPMWWISLSKALTTWLICHYTIHSPTHMCMQNYARAHKHTQLLYKRDSNCAGLWFKSAYLA